jgi:hypothetical protein
MHLKYLHYFGNESNDSILEACGIITKDKQLLDALKPKNALIAMSLTNLTVDSVQNAGWS